MKNIRLLFCFSLFAFGFISSINAQVNIIETIAGTAGSTTPIGDGGLATAGKMSAQYLMVMDAAENLYIADNADARVRMINAATGIITTIAGNGTSGFMGDGGQATAAELGGTTMGGTGVVGIAVDPGANFLYIDDATNNRIRVVNMSTGIITTICGNGTAGFAGDGGPASAATCEVSAPRGIAVDGSGNLYFADAGNQRIRMITAATGIITTMTGNGTAGYGGDGGLASSTATKVNNPRGITVDAAGDVYIADMSNDRIRVITASTGIISTVAGGAGTAGFAGDGGLAAATTTKLDLPTDMKFDAAGNMYIADVSNERIRMVNTSGIISTIAGNGNVPGGYAGDGSAATAAAVKMNSPVSVAVDPAGRFFYISDRNNDVIRIVRPNSIPYFISGSRQSLVVCENSGATPINSNLAIIDSDQKQTETWSAGAWTPLHGAAVIAGTATSNGGTITPAGKTYTPTVGYSGMDSFIVQVSDGIITVADTIIVTINPLPVVAAITGTVNVVCPSSTITLHDATGSGIWSESTGNTTVVGGVVTGVNPGTDVISYTVTNACGPTAVTYPVTVNPLPDAGTISGAAPVCLGAPLTLTDASTGGTWSASNGNASVVGGTVTGAVAGTTDDITYTVTNSCGTAFTTVTLNIITVLGAGTTLSGPASVCQGASMSLSSTVSGGAWSESTGNTTVVTGSATNVGLVTGVSTGTDIITYALTNTCGINNITQSVTVNPLPNAGSISGLTSVCVAGTITLIDAAPGGTWSASNGNASVVGGTVTGSVAGTDVISYTVNNVCGTAVATATVNIVTVPSAGVITAPVSTVCQGANITLSDAVTGGSWSASNTNATVAGGVVTGVTAGTDVITYTVMFSCGTAFTTHTVTINPLPVVAAIGGASSVCVGSSIPLTDATGSGTWTETTGNTTVSGTGHVTGVTAGSDVISYSVTNGCGATSVTKAITINPIITPAVSISASPGFTTCPGVLVTYTASPVNGGASPGYQWKVNGIPLASGSAFNFTPVTGDAITCVLTSSAACVSSLTVSASDTVVVNPTLVPAVSIAAGAGGDTICVGDLSTFTATSVNGGTVPAYQWNVNGILFATGSSFSYSPANGDIVTCSLTSSYACPIPATVTSSGITMTANTTETPTVSITVSPGNPICSGTPATFSVHSLYGGISPFYRWTKNGVNVATGPEYIYTPTFGDNIYAMMESSATCRTIDSVFSNTIAMATISSAVISVSITAASGTSFGVGQNDTLIAVVTGTSGVPGYQWYVNGTEITGATNSTYIINGAAAGTELINCVASSPCATSAISNILSLTISDVGVQQIATTGGEMKLLPNPNKGLFTMSLQSLNDEQVQVVITNTLGEKVKEFTTTTNMATAIQLDQPAGIYFLSAITEHGTYVAKVMVE